MTDPYNADKKTIRIIPDILCNYCAKRCSAISDEDAREVDKLHAKLYTADRFSIYFFCENCSIKAYRALRDYAKKESDEEEAK